MTTVTEPLVDGGYILADALFYPLLFITAALAAYYVWRQQNHIVKLGNKIPGPPTIPIFGNSLTFAGVATSGEAVEKALKLKDLYMTNGIAKAWIGSRLIVILCNPADIEVILSSSVHIDKAPEYGMFAPWFGDGLLISTGETWRNHRKIIAPAFHLNVLKSFVSQLNNNARILVERMEKEVGKEFDVHEYAAESTVDVLLETVMGVRRKEQKASTLDYAISAMKLCDYIHQRTLKIWLRLSMIDNLIGFKKDEEKHLQLVHDLSSKVFKSKMAEYESNKLSGKQSKNYEGTDDAAAKAATGTYFDQSHGLKDDLDDDVGEKKRLPFLELLIDTAKNGGPITEQQVKNQVDTIMFEGHDTIAAGASFALCIMAVLPHIQEKVYQEQYEIFGDSDRPATFSDTLEMKYLERVILESLRLFPPVPIIARKINEDVYVPSGYTLPAGTTVIIGTYGVHRRADIYPNPDQFNPDNFLPENTSKRHYYAYIPFSAGPRSCVGRKYAMLNLKITLSTIIRNYKLCSDIPVNDFKLQGDIILKRVDGFKLSIEKREKNIQI